MQKFNRDGTKTLEWLRSREQKLLEHESVKWYLKYNKQTDEFKKDLVRKYNTFLSKVKYSEAYKLYQEVKEAMSNKDIFEVKRLSAVAREKLINKEFSEAPAKFDPVYIEADFFVSQYLSIINEIKKQTDEVNLSDLNENLI